jgi:hypothetical protein
LTKWTATFDVFHAMPHGQDSWTCSMSPITNIIYPIIIWKHVMIEFLSCCLITFL